MFPYSQTKLTSQSSSHLALIAKTINHKKREHSFNYKAKSGWLELANTLFI